ncbi:MAG: polysaccharide biosynthesis tyrosine autokinase [Flavobacteriales bacterium]|nr:polysaccharide biosynthesis tyrosine autokinase [Flavobacteriales bacterium]
MNTEIISNDSTFRENIKPYLKRWKLFVISIFLAVVLAVLYVKFSTPVYKIKSTVLIKDARKMSSASGDFNPLQGLAGFNGMGTNSIENEIEILKSKKITQEVVNNLRLQTKVFSKGTYYDQHLYGDTSPFLVQVINEKGFTEDLPKSPFDISIKGDAVEISSKELKQPIKTTFNKTISFPFANLMIVKNPEFDSKKAGKLGDLYFKYDNTENVVNNLQEGIKVDLLTKNSSILGFEMNDANRDRAKDVLNELVQVYNIDAVKDINVESNKTKEFIDDRISIISKELGDVETDKERFKVQNDIVDIPTQARMSLQMSVDSRAKFLDVETQSQLNGILLNYLNKQGNSQVLPANVGLNNIAASKTIEIYNNLVLERNRLLESATTENPLVVELTNKISDVKSALRNNLEKNAITIDLAKKQYSAEFGDYSSKMEKFPTMEKLFRNLERTQQIKENLYLLLLQKREESAISMAMTSDKARIVDYAFADKKKESPKGMLSLLGALILGISLPIAYIYIRQLLDNKISTKSDIEKLSNTPIIAEIPQLGRGENELVSTNDLSQMAEAFRILVTNLKFMIPKSAKGKTVFVTSSVKGEGKTFISMNLALSLATPKIKVVVVGSDIRNPQLQRYDETKKSAKGLTEYLVGEIEDIKDIIFMSNSSPYCDIIYSGSIPPAPTDLLQNGQYKTLIDSLREHYDYIILDTPPLMLVTDSLIIADNADATIYVTRSEVSEKDYLKFANNLIASGKLVKPSFVINDVHRSNFGYGNKYGYGYHADEKTLWQKLFK